MRAFAVGRIVASRSSAYAVGDIVTGLFGWQEVAAVDASVVQSRVTEPGLPMSTALGVLGLNGLTAYFGLLEVGQPKAGETVVVSTAAGAVGSCVGQRQWVRAWSSAAWPRWPRGTHRPRGRGSSGICS
jgi:NADPH-dependent curcumin reductase CurA